MIGLSNHEFNNAGYLLFGELAGSFPGLGSEDLHEEITSLRVNAVILPLRMRRLLVSLRGREVKLSKVHSGSSRSLLEELLLGSESLSQHFFLSCSDLFASLGLVDFATIATPLLDSI